MDKLFSDIQQSLQLTNKNELMKNQQISQEKINELLEKSAEALVCGPECQKLKVSDELKQKYLDAQTNVKTAPQKLQQAEKNYYVFTEGRPYYDEKQEKELTKKASVLANMIGTNFNEEVSSAKTMNQYLNVALVNSSHTEELLDYYASQNAELMKKLKDYRGDILTNDRKTYYETQELDRLKLWYKIWYRMYYILVFVFNLCWLLCPSIITLPGKIVLSLLISFYPWYIDYVLRRYYELLTEIYKRLPRNVYNDL